MKCNVGGADRILRIVLGIVILSAGVFYKSWWGAVGLLLLLTGIFRFCLAYIPFGFTTCKEDKK
jgi:hypothetical protein